MLFMHFIFSLCDKRALVIILTLGEPGTPMLFTYTKAHSSHIREQRVIDGKFNQNKLHAAASFCVWEMCNFYATGEKQFFI
jgi:hypothetical protein